MKALERALAILNEHFTLASSSDQETLGIAGAICKRRWQATGHKDELERSYQYYRRGYDAGLEKDIGYTGIDAAFVSDQLADIEADDGTPLVATRRGKAKDIREALVARLPPLRNTNSELAVDWWYIVTVAEALFGLGRYDEAQRWLLEAKAVPNVPDWEFRTTAAQLATLYQLQHRGTPSPHDPAAANAAKVLDACRQLRRRAGECLHRQGRPSPIGRRLPGVALPLRRVGEAGRT